MILFTKIVLFSFHIKVTTPPILGLQTVWYGTGSVSTACIFKHVLISMWWSVNWPHLAQTPQFSPSLPVHDWLPPPNAQSLGSPFGPQHFPEVSEEEVQDHASKFWLLVQTTNRVHVKNVFIFHQDLKHLELKSYPRQTLAMTHDKMHVEYLHSVL